MIEIKKKSVVPVYGTVAVCVIYCLIANLHVTWQFVMLIAVGLISYGFLAMLFPGSCTQVTADEKPVSTGDEKVDTLLSEGQKSVAEMRRLSATMPNEEVKAKAENLVNITDQIFNKLRSEPGVYSQVKRFSEFYLPTSVKLLGAYDSFGQSGVEGDNITSTMERINSAMDTILPSYKKFYDSLFEDKALDIETDISVMETMLKRDGLLENDFTNASSQNEPQQEQQAEAQYVPHLELQSDPPQEAPSQEQPPS